MISAPYSFEAAPVELIFAKFKRGDLDPTNVSLKKK